MNAIPYNNDKARCPKCGGMLAYDARMTEKLPLGFGFNAAGKFQIDYILRTGFRGECMECGTQIFAVQKERQGSREPRAINRKLREKHPMSGQPPLNQSPA